MKVMDYPSVDFYKLQGSGNDFVVILKDNIKLSLSYSDMSNWAKKICKRCFGVGADGLIFLEKDDVYSYRWHFYNSDGSRAEMCGNGSRCVAWLAYNLGIAEKVHKFATDAGPIKAEVFPADDSVNVQLTSPKDLRLDIEIGLPVAGLKVHFVNTGVPHVVIFTEEEDIDVCKLGKSIRFHSMFSPDGTNVNFVKVKEKGLLFVRTYERGVEKETYACGTGASASVFIANALGLCDKRVKVVTSGGEELFISIEGKDIFLKGKVCFIYQGKLNLRGLGLIV